MKAGWLSSLWLLGVVGCGAATPGDDPGGRAVVSQALVVAAPASGGPSRIAFSIREMAHVVTTQSRARAVSPATMSNALLHLSASGDIEVLVHARGALGAAEEADLTALGAQVTERLSARLPVATSGIVQAWVPLSSLDALDALPWIAAVTPPGYPQPDLGSIVSEGVSQLRANLAQGQGITGAGVTVGVVSDGVSTVASSQARNETPANCPATPCLNVLGAGGGDEGTAMLEIVADMAPGANLLFQGTGGSVVSHVNALTNLVANGANVIAEDIPFDAEPAFQQGLAAATAEAIAAGGVSVHSSAGNLGGVHAARVTAVGTGGGPDGVTFSSTPPGCANTPGNVVAIAPGGDTTFDVVLGGGDLITLQWSEPRAIFPTAGQGGFTDLNLYVMDAGLTRCLAQSAAVQGNGQGDTIEQVVISGGFAGVAAKIVVDVQGTSSAAAAPVVDLRMRNSTLVDATTRAGSLNPDSNYVGLASAVAAIRAGSGGLESFSAAGPVQLGVTTTCPGGAAGPCSGVAGGGVTSFAGPVPNWSATDGSSVSGVGSFGSGTCPAPTSGGQGQCLFFGTSAAAPHSAGCDALVREIVGATAPVATVRGRMAGTAVNLPPAGPDSSTGAGRLDCFAALGPPTAVCRNVTAPVNAICVAPVTPGQVDGGSSDPNGDPLTFSLDPPGPFPLGANGVTLTASDGRLTSNCTATVTAVDLTPPAFTFVPPAITVNTCGPVALGGPATAVDNCAGTPTVTNDAPPKFFTGATTVTWTATDAAGNQSKAAQVVTVVDTVKPVFTFVPGPIIISSCKSPDIGHATATDDCGVTVTNDAPAVFPLGTTVVTWTATDPSGNTAKKTQSVTAVLADDASCCPAGSHVIIGTNHSDTIVGTAGADCILGLGGNDIIDGRGGDDAISGGAGADTIQGGYGNDRIYGGGDNDTIDAGPDNDFIDGGPGIDVCAGGTGTNVVMCEVASGR